MTLKDLENLVERAKKPKPVKKRTARDRVLAQSGRQEPLPPAVTAKSVLESAKALEQFREWRKDTGI